MVNKIRNILKHYEIINFRASISILIIKRYFIKESCFRSLLILNINWQCVKGLYLLIANANLIFLYVFFYLLQIIHLYVYNPLQLLILLQKHLVSFWVEANILLNLFLQCIALLHQRSQQLLSFLSLLLNITIITVYYLPA